MYHETVIAALEPWVGRMAADTCVRATAISAGKNIEEFGRDEISMLAENIRRLLAPIAPRAAVDGVVAQIEAGVA